MSELPPYVRDVDQSPPPSPEAVLGQAGRPAVSPPPESALALSGGGAPPPVPAGAGGEAATASPYMVPPGTSGAPVVTDRGIPFNFNAPPPSDAEFGPGPQAQESAAQRAPLQGITTQPAPAGAPAVAKSPEPTKTAAAPPPKQPAPGDAPLATTPGTAALPAPEVSSAPYKGTIPMAGFNWLANTQPDVFNLLATVGQSLGVSTERLVQHARMESDFRLGKVGDKGEIGPFQIHPDTQKDLQTRYLGGRQVDANTWEGGALLASLKIRECDRRGADSYASVACYNGAGPDSKTYTANYFSDKKSGDYSKLNFGDLDKPNGGSTMSANGAVRAAQQGPDSFQRYIVDASGRGSSMSDAWQHVQSLMLEHFIRKGDMDGAEKAQQFVMQQAFMGSNMHLLGAKASLERGDAITAIQQLAKAHAFFPDGTAGRFMTNGRDVFGVRLDETTGKQLGSPFRITAQDIDSQLKFTTNLVTFSKFLSDQQKTAADLRLKHAQAGYQEVKPALDVFKEEGRREGRAATIAQAERTQQYIDRRQATANAEAAARAARDKDPETAAQLDKFMTDLTGDWAVPDKDEKGSPIKGSAREQLYTSNRNQLARSLRDTSLRAGGVGMDPQRVRYLTDEYLKGTFSLAATPGGFTFIDKKTQQQVPGAPAIDIPTGELLSEKRHPTNRQQQGGQQAQPQAGGAGAPLAQHATGNAVAGGRSSVEGTSAEMTSRVQRMVADMPPENAQRFRIISGHRSAERQREVNPSVTNSRHMYGKALDLSGDPQVLAWVNQNGRRYGLGFPLSSDPKERNHMEMVDAQGRRASL